ncbi:MAG: DegT/DnrJ/EryC1/StrS family aminotransferase [Phycisphaerales bacterium]
MSTALSQRPEVRALAVHGGTPVADEKIQLIAVRLDERDIDAAVEVMRSGMLAQGRHVMAFEELFASVSGARHAAACANGTCALQLAYGGLIERGDEVLCPAWSYIATASMLEAAGAKVVWVDADPVTYGIDVEDARRKCTDKTVAIAATHIYGNPVDIDGVEKLAIDKGLSVVYDAAQAHLATYKGRGIGAFGDAVTYSFYPTKNMTTGEGGMVTTNDEELLATLRALRSHGESAKYEHSSIGFNYRMTDVEGAVGLEQLKRLPGYTDRRRANARALDAMLAGIEGLHAPTPTDGAEHAYHLYAIRIDEDAFVAPEEGKTIRDMITEAMHAEGVATAIHYPRSLTRQPVFDRPGVAHQPVSDRLARTLFCVPVHQYLSEQELARVGEALAKVAGAYRA